MPLNVPVDGSQLSHDGSGWPFDKAAVKLRVSFCGSVNVLAAGTKASCVPSVQVCAAV